MHVGKVLAADRAVVDAEHDNEEIAGCSMRQLSCRDCLVKVISHGWFYHHPTGDWRGNQIMLRLESLDEWAFHATGLDYHLDK